MKRIICFLSIMILLICVHDSVYAKIVVKSVRGEAAYKKGRQWKPLTKGLELQEGTKISTGVRSSAEIMIDNNTLRVRQLTMMKIYRNRTAKKTRSTHIGLKYGSLNARVKKIRRLKTSFKVTTPVATSSVRGTKEYVSYGAKSGMLIKVEEGSVESENPDGIFNIITGKSVFRLGIDDPRPGNLLSDVRNDSTTRTSPNNVTGDEKNYDEFFGNEIIGGSEGPINIYSSNTDFVGDSGTSDINVILEWPDEEVDR